MCEINFEEVILISELHDASLMVERLEVELTQRECDCENGYLIIERIEEGGSEVIYIDLLWHADEVVMRDAKV